MKFHFKPKEEFQCNVCGVKLGFAKNLLEHTHGMHIKGDFLYTCKCGKGYYYNSHFSLHKQICKGDSTDASKESGGSKETENK